MFPTDALKWWRRFPLRHPAKAGRLLCRSPAVCHPRCRARPSPSRALVWFPRPRRPPALVFAPPSRAAPRCPRPEKGRAKPHQVPPPSLKPPREPRLRLPSRIPSVLMYRPPRRSTADGGAGMWNPPSAAVPFGQNAQGRFDSEAHRSNGEFDPFGVGLMRHRVVPPTSNLVRLADDLVQYEEEDAEEARTGNSIPE